MNNTIKRFLEDDLTLLWRVARTTDDPRDWHRLCLWLDGVLTGLALGISTVDWDPAWQADVHEALQLARDVANIQWTTAENDELEAVMQAEIDISDADADAMTWNPDYNRTDWDDC